MEYGRVADDGGVWRNVSGHDGACPDHGEFTNGNAWEDDRASANRCTLFDGCFLKFSWKLFGSGFFVVCKCDIWSNENVVLQGDSVVEMYAVLYSDIVPNDNIVLDKAVRADIAVRADYCIGKNDAVLPYFCPRANGRALYIGKRVGKKNCFMLVVYFHAEAIICGLGWPCVSGDIQFQV